MFQGYMSETLFFSLLLVKLIFSYHIPIFTYADQINLTSASHGYDECRFFELNNSIIYRMGQNNILQSWNSQSYAALLAQQASFMTLDKSDQILNVGLGHLNNQIVASLINDEYYMFDPFDLTIVNGYTETLFGQTLIKVQTTTTQYLQLIYSDSSQNYVIVYDKYFNFITQFYLNFTGIMNSTLSKDQTTLAVWNYKGQVRFVEKQGGNWIVCYQYNAPLNIPTAIQTMNTVTLSQNGSIAILQYDSQLPLTVVNYRETRIIAQVLVYSTVINKAIFLDTDCHLIGVIRNYQVMKIYDTLTLTYQSSSTFAQSSNYSAINYSSGRLYICLSETIQIILIECPSKSYRNQATNQCIACQLANNCSECDKTTGVCNSCDIDYVLNGSDFTCSYNGSVVSNFTNSTNLTSLNNINSNSTNSSNTTSSSMINSTTTSYQSAQLYQTISQTEAYIVIATIDGFTTLTPIIGIVFTVIQMSSFVIFFLSFINYWSLTCLYSILKINVPNYLLIVNKIIFDSIQTSLFSLIGFNPTIPALNDKQFDQDLPISYGITLDFFQANTQNIFMIMFLIIFIIVVRCIKNIFLNKSRFAAKYLKFSIMESILGQFISFIPLCIIPFKYLADQPIFNTFRQKINIVLQVNILFLCLSAPLLFIWIRKKLTLQQKLKSTQPKIQKAYQIKSKNIIQKAKQIDKDEKNQNQKQFQMLLLNISVPILIILPVYLPFFVVNFIIFSYGVKKASDSKEYRINSIINSCYLPLYHLCYFVIYVFEGNQQICHYTGLLCLCILFLGGIHELGSLIIINSITLVQYLVKKICKSSKISVIPQQKPQCQTKKSKCTLKQLPINNKLQNNCQQLCQKYSKNEQSQIYQKFKAIKFKPKLRNNKMAIKTKALEIAFQKQKSNQDEIDNFHFQEKKKKQIYQQ